MYLSGVSVDVDNVPVISAARHLPPPVLFSFFADFRRLKRLGQPFTEKGIFFGGENIFRSLSRQR
jgi:hypothetical protein